MYNWDLKFELKAQSLIWHLVGRVEIDSNLKSYYSAIKGHIWVFYDGAEHVATSCNLSQQLTSEDLSFSLTNTYLN